MWYRPRFWLQSLHLRPVDKRYALTEACAIGIVSALAALALKRGIDWVGSYRIQLANIHESWLILPLLGLTLGFSAGWIVERVAPAASGGGIPQVKAVLAQHSIPLSLQVAIVKLVGTILVLGAGLTLGRRGPTVHIGAALAAQLSTWVPTSPEHRRQMIAAGAAAGLAAGFNTPIAGIFFVVEELMRDVSGLTLETAILASFTGAIVSRIIGSADLRVPSNMQLWETSFTIEELPFYILLGITAGILGVIFNRGVLTSLKIYRHLGWGMPLRVGVAGLISGIAIANLPPFFQNNAGLREFLIIGDADWQATALALVAHFFLTLVAYGSGAPGGLFAPALVLGSALGDLIGTAEVALLGAGSAHTFALAGMGAFFTAVVRVPVTAIIIVFELTAQFEAVLPLMIVCAIAYIVAENLHKGSLYQHLLAAKGIQLEDETSINSLLAGMKAEDLMQRSPDTLPATMSLDQARQVFSESPHRGFPVVAHERLLGVITQTDLARLTSRSGRMPLRALMTPRPLCVRPKAPISEVLYLLDRYQLSHLPVTENQRLVGIITRHDIIQAEAHRLSGEAMLQHQASGRTRNEPSYVVYQTRAPAVGKGRVLLPIANPETASALLQIAAAIAHQRHAELEVLHVMEVPRHYSPATARVETHPGRSLLQKAEAIGHDWEIPVHTQVRLAHDAARSILEAIEERQISLLILGWKGCTTTPGRIFGNVVDDLVRLAPCDVALIKLGERRTPIPPVKSKWLIPISGGPNVQRALELLPALSAWAKAEEFWLCQVFSPESRLDTAILEAATEKLKEKTGKQVIGIPVRSPSVSEAVIHLVETEDCDAIVLGASRQGLLSRTIQGNIPEAIARAVDRTVILVRGGLETGT